MKTNPKSPAFISFLASFIEHWFELANSEKKKNILDALFEPSRFQAAPFPDISPEYQHSLLLYRVWKEELQGVYK